MVPDKIWSGRTKHVHLEKKKRQAKNVFTKDVDRTVIDYVVTLIVNIIIHFLMF